MHGMSVVMSCATVVKGARVKTSKELRLLLATRTSLINASVDDQTTSILERTSLINASVDDQTTSILESSNGVV